MFSRASWIIGNNDTDTGYTDITATIFMITGIGIIKSVFVWDESLKKNLSVYLSVWYKYL